MQHTTKFKLKIKANFNILFIEDSNQINLNIKMKKKLKNIRFRIVLILLFNLWIGLITQVKARRSVIKCSPTQSIMNKLEFWCGGYKSVKLDELKIRMISNERKGRPDNKVAQFANIDRLMNKFIYIWLQLESKFALERFHDIISSFSSRIWLIWDR